MPGQHVDEVYDEIVKNLLDDKASNSAGSQAFESVEKNDTLTPQEKQEVHQRLGKAAMQHELAKANNQPTTFLRLASPATNYITAYLKEYAKEYNAAVLDVAKQEVAKTKIPNDPGLKERFPVMGGVRDQMSKEKPETLQSLTESTQAMASRIVQAHDDNLHKLSSEAQEFLKVSMEPVMAQNSVELTGKAMSSTLMLKNTGPMIGEYAQSLGASQQNTENLTEQQMQGSVLLQASKVMQSYANNVHKPPGSDLKKSGKAQDVMAEKLLTDENLTRTKNAYDALGKGGQDFVDLKNELAQKELAALTLADKQQKLAPFDNQIKSLEQRRDQLKNNPTFGDKFKAFFKHGLKGVDGEIAKLETKIEVTKIAREDTATGVSMDLRREAVQRLKHNEAALEHEIQQAKAVVVANNVEQSMNLKSTVTPGQLDDAFKHHDNLAPAKKEIGEAIKTQERVLSVREKLGAQPHIPTEGPKKGIKV